MGKNWKTTLLGILGALGLIFGNALTNKANDPNAPAVNAANLVPAVAVAILGIVAKDNDVTGGTKQQ